jgi:hypothetical protein
MSLGKKKRPAKTRPMRRGRSKPVTADQGPLAAPSAPGRLRAPETLGWFDLGGDPAAWDRAPGFTTGHPLVWGLSGVGMAALSLMFVYARSAFYGLWLLGFAVLLAASAFGTE